MQIPDDLSGTDPTGMRPDHPDFWRLSQTILKLDGGFEDGKDPSEDVSRRLGDIHIPSLTYMASQRAMIICRQLPLPPGAMDVIATMVAAAWIEGYCVRENLPMPNAPATELWVLVTDDGTSSTTEVHPTEAAALESLRVNYAAETPAADFDMQQVCDQGVIVYLDSFQTPRAA